MDERVLLSVEDRDPDFYLIQIALKEAGIAIQVCRVSNGEDAILFLHQSGKFAGCPKPDLVLLNTNMPRKSGFEVLEYMKSNDSFRSIPVVMFTTSSDPRDRMRALSLGAEEYIIKRNSFGDLIEDLSGVCARFLKDSHTRSANRTGTPSFPNAKGSSA